MSEEDQTVPEGCLGCNAAQVGPLLAARGIEVEEVPDPRPEWRDVIVCPRCDRAWLLMPRRDDPSKPTA